MQRVRLVDANGAIESVGLLQAQRNNSLMMEFGNVFSGMNLARCILCHSDCSSMQAHARAVGRSGRFRVRPVGIR